MTLPFDRRAPRGRREAARPPVAPSARTEKQPNARSRKAAARMKDFQQTKRAARVGEKAPEAKPEVHDSPPRKKRLVERIIEKVWSPSSTQDAQDTPPTAHPPLPAPSVEALPPAAIVPHVTMSARPRARLANVMLLTPTLHPRRRRRGQLQRVERVRREAAGARLARSASHLRVRLAGALHIATRPSELSTWATLGVSRASPLQSGSLMRGYL